MCGRVGGGFEEHVLGGFQQRDSMITREGGWCRWSLRSQGYSMWFFFVLRATTHRHRRLTCMIHVLQVGSWAYMAPEVITSSGDTYDGCMADVWSCGVVLFAMVFGQVRSACVGG